jgi:hypothetical protein
MALFNGQTISPGTLHIAQLVRQEAEAEQQGKRQPEERRLNWVRIAIEFAIAAILLFVIYQVVTTRQTAIAQDVPIGRMRFSFANNDNDTITLSLNRGSPPEDNEHFEAWLVHDDGSFRDVGRFTFDTSGVGRLEYTDPDANNLFEGVKELRITREQNNSSASTKPVGEVVYSSIFPPKALAHVRKLVVSFDGGKDQASLIGGLYYYSGSYIEAAINGDPDFPSYVGMTTAYENGDEDSLRKRNEEVINMIVGSESDQYRDYDEDGTLDTQANGYGSLRNGNQVGYLEQTALEAQAAAEVPDTTLNIRQQNANLQICIQNMKGWTDQILPLVLQLQGMQFGPEMKPIIDELSSLGKALSSGVDVDKNGTISPVEGECGAFNAYYYGIYMADFPIFIGPNRVPPTVVPTVENK